MGNQKWASQRHRQHWTVQDTESVKQDIHVGLFPSDIANQA